MIEVLNSGPYLLENFSRFSRSAAVTHGCGGRVEGLKGCRLEGLKGGRLEGLKS